LRDVIISHAEADLSVRTTEVFALASFLGDLLSR